MKAEHTPGPWYVPKHEPYSIKSEDWGGIASVWNEPAENDALMAIAQADARLIAAAPDLLEALEGCLEWMDANLISTDTSGLEDRKAARAAIAKAKEETK